MTMTIKTSSGSLYMGMVEGYIFDKTPAILDIMANGRFAGQVKIQVHKQRNNQSFL